LLDFSALEDLMKVVNLYKSRTFDEELEFVKTGLGGEQLSSDLKRRCRHH